MTNEADETPGLMDISGAIFASAEAWGEKFWKGWWKTSTCCTLNTSELAICPDDYLDACHPTQKTRQWWIKQ